MAGEITFTDRRLAALQPPQRGRRFLYDKTERGLELCLTAAGARIFYFRWRFAGDSVHVRLGRWPAMSIDEARDRAHDLRGDAHKNRDPRASGQAAREGLTLGEAFAAYVADHLRRYRKHPDAAVREFDVYLRPWRNRRLVSITGADVRTLHNRVPRLARLRAQRRAEAAVRRRLAAGAPEKLAAALADARAKVPPARGRYAANRTLQLLRATINFAINELGYAGPNPAAGVRPFAEEERDRFLLPDELPRFFAALNAEPNATARDFFWLLLLTGARRANVQAMRWADIRLDGNPAWTIPAAATKSGKRQAVPLVAEAVAILRERRDALGEGGEYVFPADSKSGHLQEPRGAWLRLLKRAGLSGLRLHDLRRTLGSWQAGTGSSLAVIGRTLGHTSPEVTQIYARLDLDPVRASVEKAVAAMRRAGAKGEAGKIVKFRRGGTK